MIHLNPMIKKGEYGIGYALVAPFLPSTYIAPSIKDFIDQRETVKTSGFLTDYPGSALIAFRNVQLAKTNDLRCRINDLSGEFVCGVPWKLDDEIDDGRYYILAIEYDPKRNLARLDSFEKFGPKAGETSKEKGLTSLLTPAFNNI